MRCSGCRLPLWVSVLLCCQHLNNELAPELMNFHLRRQEPLDDDRKNRLAPPGSFLAYAFQLHQQSSDVVRDVTSNAARMHLVKITQRSNLQLPFGVIARV